MEILLYLAGYAAVGSTVSQIVWRAFYPTERFDESAGPTLSGVFWPVAIPIILPLAARKGLAKLPKREEAKAIAYSQAPTTVLAHLVAQKMLQHIDGFQIGYDKWNSEDGKITVEVRSSSGLEFYRLVVNGDSWLSSKMPGKDRKILSKAFQEGYKLREQKIANDALAAIQHQALNAVEKLLLTPEKPVEHPMGSHD